MPLIKSGSKAAISQNISEMVHAGHPQKQAVAAALRNARQYGDASGGRTKPDPADALRKVLQSPAPEPVTPTTPEDSLAQMRRLLGAPRASGGITPPMGSRFAARQAFHEGFLHSNVPGRTDKLPISVSGGAYVLPADHVAALGQGNSLAGADRVNKMFKMGPYGTPASPQHAARATVPKLNLTPKAPKMTLKGGGIEGHGKPTNIIAAGGEMTIPPHKIIERYGDLKKGHRELDRWVLSTRAAHIKTLKKLKPPKDD